MRPHMLIARRACRHSLCLTETSRGCTVEWLKKAAAQGHVLAVAKPARITVVAVGVAAAASVLPRAMFEAICVVETHLPVAHALTAAQRRRHYCLHTLPPGKRRSSKLDVVPTCARRIARRRTSRPSHTSLAHASGSFKCNFAWAPRVPAAAQGMVCGVRARAAICARRGTQRRRAATEREGRKGGAGAESLLPALLAADEPAAVGHPVRRNRIRRERCVRAVLYVCVCGWLPASRERLGGPLPASDGPPGTGAARARSSCCSCSCSSVARAHAA